MGSRGLGRAAAVAVAATVAVTSCSPSANRGTTSPSAIAPILVTAAPASTAPLQARVVARVPIENPDGLAAVGESIWVKTDDGRAVRVDPRSNQVTGTVRLDTTTDGHHYCQGMGSDGTTLWACAATDLTTDIVQIDPTKLTAGRPAVVDKVFDQLTLPHTSRGLWVLSGEGRELAMVAPKTRDVTTYPLPARCLQVAANEAIVIVTCAPANLVLAVDPSNGRIRRQARLPTPRLALVTDRDIWVDSDQGLTRLGPDLSERAVFPNQHAGLDGDLAVFGDDLWVRGHGGVMWRIDPANNAVVEQLTSDPPISGGSLLVTEDAIWATAGDEGYLLRLSR